MIKSEKFYKKPGYIILAAFAIILILILIFSLGKTEEPQYETALVTRGDVTEEVSVTGRVEADEKIDLAFETSGKVAKVYVKVGDKVKAGDKLVILASADLAAQLRQAQAGVASAQAQLNQYEAALASQQARLDEMNRGTRPEEIQIAETNLFNAGEVLKDAETNLKNVKSKADVDLEGVYSSSLTSLTSAALAAREALYALTDIQYAHFGDMSQESVRVDIAKAPAVQALLGPANAGRWTTEFLSRENGGAYGEVIATVTSPADDKIDSAITNLLDALTKVKSALNAVPVTDELTTTERLNLETAKSGVSAQITTVTGGQKTIAAQKALNRNLIQTAETQVNAAKNSLANAQNQLDLSKAGYTPEQIKAQEAVVKQAEANIASQRAMVNQAYANSQRYQAEIDKTIMLAPIAGVITTIDAKVGEIIFPTTAAPKQAALVSIISDGNYKITSNIAEVDVSKVKTGDVARVTLDAYGNSVKFEAVVSEIDPAETIVESVPTYKTTLRFRDQDPRIKSGMTANLDIVTANKENVLIIPQRAVISHDGSRLVRILAMEEDGKTTAIHEVPVTTGIRGTEGQMEIIEGLKEGDVVITFEKK